MTGVHCTSARSRPERKLLAVLEGFMGMAATLSALLRWRRVPPRPRADSVVGVREFLRGEQGEAIVLPLLPATGAGLADVEFAAASVVERIVLGALVHRERPARIFEIGTFRGVTALSMATNCSWEAVLYTLDLPPDLSARTVNDQHYGASATSGFRHLAEAGVQRDVGAALRGYEGLCRVVQLFGDAAAFDFSPYSDIDLFFVDGCHEYAGALRDSEIARDRLKPGGLVIWHDYTRDDVQRAARAAWLGVPITWIEQTTLAFARRP